MGGKPTFTSFFALSAVAALFVAFMPGSTTPATTATEEEAAARSASRVATPDYRRGSRLIAEFCGEAPSDSTPRCLHTLELDVLITTVPDPWDSSIDWGYDAYLESVRRGLQTAGFISDRFWFAARGDSVTIGTGPDSSRLARRAVEPGVMLFRSPAHKKREELMLVYVVNELPTSGVHKEALRNALEERHRLLQAVQAGRTRPDTVEIVGPAFSGSSVSIARALADWQPDSGSRPVMRVISGSATNSSNASVMQARGIDYEQVLRTDDDMLHALEHVLMDSIAGFGIPARKIAVLHENTTQYGAAIKVMKQVRRLPFPVGIASVRTAYERQPRPAEGAAVRRAPRVQLPIGEAPPALTPPIASQMTPASIDIMLTEIIRTLQRDEVSTVIILATDVRDKLFLGDVLRQHMRDVQLVTLESNLLYAHDSRSSSLRGMLVVSTYPLVLDNQKWTSLHGKPAELLAFMSDGAQGIYNATLRAVGMPGQLEHRAPLQLQARGDTAPVWLTVVGAGRMLPLRPYDHADTSAAIVPLGGDAGCRPVRDFVVRPRLCAQYDSPSMAGFRGHYSMSFVALLLMMTLGFVLVGASGRYMVDCVVPPAAIGGRGHMPRRLLQLNVLERRTALLRPKVTPIPTVVQRSVLELHSELYTGARLLGLFIMFTPFAFVGIMASQPGSYLGIVLVATLLVPLLAIGAMAAVAANWALRTASAWLGFARLELRRWSGWHWYAETACRFAVVGVLVYLAVTVVVWLGDLVRLGGYRQGLFKIFYARSAEFFSGVSPLMPVMLIGAGVVLWSSWNIARIRSLRDGNAFQTAVLRENHKRRADDADAPVGATLASLQEPVVRFRSRLFFLFPDAGVALVVIISMALLTLWLWPQFGLSFEALLFPRSPSLLGDATAFDRLLRVGIVGGFWACVWAILRMWLLWNAMRRTLTAVASTPLIERMKTLPASLSRLVQPTLFGRADREQVIALASRQWARLAGLLEDQPAIIDDICHALGDERPRRPGEKRAPAGVMELKALGAALRRPMPGSRHDLRVARWAADETMLVEIANDRLAQELERMNRVVDACWRLEPSPAAIEEAVTSRKAAVSEWVSPAAPAGRHSRFTLPESALFLQAMEEFIAVQVVDYIEWSQQSLRRMAPFVLSSLLLMTLLLSSYQVAPQQLLKVMLIWLVAATMAVSMIIMTGMSRDETVSVLTGTNAGRIEWDTTFVLNVLLYVLVPVVALVGAEVPFVRDVLFSWVEPMLRSVAKL